MEDEIFKIFKHYNDHGLLANRDFVNDICDIICETEELSDYISRRSFDDEIIGIKEKGFYNLATKTLYFNFERILNEIKGKEKFPDTYYFFYNSIILLAIYHELTHVKQAKDFLEDKNPDIVNKTLSTLEYNNTYYELYSNCIKIFIQNIYYQKYWDISPWEKMANIDSEKKIFKILNRIDDDLDIIRETKDFLTIVQYLHKLAGYKLRKECTNSPSIDYLKHVPLAGNASYLRKKMPLIYSKIFSYELRLYYGLSLSKEEYFSLLEQYHQETENKIIKISI